MSSSGTIEKPKTKPKAADTDTKRMAYRFRLYPTADQERTLAAIFAACRRAYNWNMALPQWEYAAAKMRLYDHALASGTVRDYDHFQEVWADTRLRPTLWADNPDLKPSTAWFTQFTMSRLWTRFMARYASGRDESEDLEVQEWCRETEARGLNLDWLWSQPPSTEYEWMLVAPSNALRAVYEDVARARTAYFKNIQQYRANPRAFRKVPRLAYRRAQAAASFRIENSNAGRSFRLHESRRRVSLLKFREGIRIREHRELPDSVSIKTYTVSRTSSGRYYIAVSVDTNTALPKVPTYSTTTLPENPIGIDFGLRNIFTTSDGDIIRHPKHYRQLLQRLNREQRRRAKMVGADGKARRSNNLRRQDQKIAKIHAAIADARSNFLHEFTTAIVRAHDAVFLEDLNVSEMAREKGGGRRTRQCQCQCAGSCRYDFMSRMDLYDASWAQARAMLEYKCEWAGIPCVVIPANSTSMTCSRCQYHYESLRSGQRQWVCPACETPHDRDVNAARNILTRGLEVLTKQVG